MSSIPVPDEQTYYSSRRQDDVDALAWPVFSQHALDLLRSAGEVLHPEGEFLDTVIGIPGSRTEIVMLQPPDGGTRLEFSSFARPDHLPGSPAAPANELGLRYVAFEVHDLQAAVDRVATDGCRLVGGIGEYEGFWRMAYVRGPEGIIVSLAERIS